VEELSGFACAKRLSYTWLYDVRVLENPSLDLDVADADRSVMVSSGRELRSA
jgi:hypothetical protein